MKRLILQSCLALLCASSVVFAYDPPASGRAKYNFNSGWKLFVGDPAGAEAPGFDDSAWKEVTLPRAWNEDDAFKKDIKDLSTGVAWYRKRFWLPQGAAGLKVFLEFEGVRPAGEFYLNGKSLGLGEQSSRLLYTFSLTPSASSLTTGWSSRGAPRAASATSPSPSRPSRAAASKGRADGRRQQPRRLRQHHRDSGDSRPAVVRRQGRREKHSQHHRA